MPTNNTSKLKQALSIYVMIVTIKFDILHNFCCSISNNNLFQHLVSSNWPLHTSKACTAIHLPYEFSLHFVELRMSIL